MSLAEIQEAWSAHESTPFPMGHRMKEINGKNVSVLESEVGGYIMTFLNTGGRLGARQYLAMKAFQQELPDIVNQLEGEGQKYFDSLRKIADMVMAICKDPEEA